MRGLLAAGLLSLCLLFGGSESASANCTAPCTKSQVTTDVNTNWPDNTTQLITPALLRSTVLDLVNSYLDINGASSFACGSNQFMTQIVSLSTYQCALVTVAGLSGFGTGVAAALATNIGSAGAPVLFGGAGGTPSSIVLTNATGCPIASCVSGLGASVAAALATGIGSAGAPVLFNGAGGTPSSITLTNATACAISSCVSGLGTGVATQLANAVSTAGGSTQTVAAGSTALGVAAIASTACASVVSPTATGVTTTDVVTAAFNADPSAVTGYVPVVTGMLTIFIFPTSNAVNFKVCNSTSASITPGAITLNWRVVR